MSTASLTKQNARSSSAALLSSQGATTLKKVPSAQTGISGQPDVEVFGGVVTNIEKLLTPRQKVKIQTVLKKKARSSNLTVTRQTAKNRKPALMFNQTTNQPWKQGYQTRSHSQTNQRGVSMDQTCFNPQPKTYHFEYQPDLAKSQQSAAKIVASRVSNYVNRDTCSPFKAHQQHMQQIAREEYRRHQKTQMQVMLSPSAREAQAMEKRKKALYPTQVVSANTLNLRHEHHLKKSVLSFNQQNVFKSMKESCFAADYDILTKNTAFQKVREADNVRLSQSVIEKRTQDEQEYNAKCRMEQKTHIQQMEANAQRQQPVVPLVQLSKERIDQHLNRRSRQKNQLIGQEPWSQSEGMKTFIANLEKQQRGRRYQAQNVANNKLQSKAQVSAPVQEEQKQTAFKGWLQICQESLSQQTYKQICKTRQSFQANNPRSIAASRGGGTEKNSSRRKLSTFNDEYGQSTRGSFIGSKRRAQVSTTTSAAITSSHANFFSKDEAKRSMMAAKRHQSLIVQTLD